MPPETHGIRVEKARRDPPLVRWGLTFAALAVLFVLVVVPVLYVFQQALRDGLPAYWDAIANDPDTTKAIRMTLLVAPPAVIANTLFGLTAAWAIARFRFRGRTLLLALIDLPFAVSPVVAGLALVLIFGLQGMLGPFLREHHIRILFNTPGIILATAFVTFPFVVRELIPVLEADGPEEELAAITLGANGWQMFWRVTLPNIKYGLLYGIILCTARAVGEFGAVYVVSGRVYGGTDTVPLRVEKLYQDARMPASFAVASILTALALLTLVLKTLIERAEKNRVARLRAERGGST